MLAEAVGERKPEFARAQQDLGRAERAGGQHHGLGRDGARTRLLAIGGGEMDAPMGALALDMADGELGEDLGAMGVRVGQISERDGVLGADIAARAAIAAQRAGGLRDAGGIDGLGEAHHHRGGDGGLTEAGARRFQRAIFGEIGRGRITRRAQHGGGARIAHLQQAVVAHLLGPGGIGEDARVGLQRDGGIDERAAAEPAADEHMDVAAEPEIEQAGAIAAPHLAAIDLELAPQLGQAARELAGHEFAPALDDADAHAGAREPRGGDAAAIARADHDRVVGILDGVGG